METFEVFDCAVSRRFVIDHGPVIVVWMNIECKTDDNDTDVFQRKFDTTRWFNNQVEVELHFYPNQSASEIADRVQKTLEEVDEEILRRNILAEDLSALLSKKYPE